jgi:uncharacterized DUF497 family protein
MEFEFDERKSAANRDKHGMDFVQAQELWRIASWEQDLPYVGEPRQMITGMIAGKLWSAVYTMRGKTVRLISVRRARIDEAESYGRHFAEQGDDD